MTASLHTRYIHCINYRPGGIVGHFLFVMLHIIAVAVAGIGLLFLTIPMHLIYGVIASRGSGGSAKPQYVTHVRCHACSEYVLREANKCKHCGEALTPQPLVLERSAWDRMAHPDAKPVDRRYPQ